MLKIATTLFLFSIIIIGGSIFLTAPVTSRGLSRQFPQTENSGKFALLIGINKYKNGIPPLNGAVADIRAMEKLLTGDKFGFPNPQVRSLTDEEATGKNILGAFRDHLIKNAKDYKEKTGLEATVFFHFSGHGSQAAPPDFMTKTDEPDGFDETIVPVDSREPDKFDIKDDEIFELVSELSEHTSNVVYVFDSCNSGTLSRGGGVARETATDKRKQPAYRIRKVKGKASKDKNYDDLLVGSDKFVMIAGTRSSQKSYEMKMPDGTYRGALSFYLQRALGNASPQTTYAELMRRVATQVNHHNSNQEPQISGGKKRFILGGKIKEGEIPIPVVDVDSKRKIITIGAGKMLGLRNGSLIAVHRRDGSRTAEGVVIEVENSNAVVQYTLLGDRSIDPKTDLAKLLSPLFGAEPVRVNLPLGDRSNSRSSTSVGDAILRDVAKELATNSKALLQIEILEPGQKDRTINKGINVPAVNVERAAFREAFCGGIRIDNVRSKSEADIRCRQLLPEPSPAEDGKASTPVPNDEDEVFYLAPTESGEPVFDFFVRVTDKKAVKKIADALRKFARQKNLMALEHGGGEIAGDLKIEFIEVQGRIDDVGEFIIDSETATLLESGGVMSKPTDTYYRLRITNKSRMDLYITVLGLSNDGRINVMYPREVQEPLYKGKSTKTGLYVTTRPFGKERIKIIATKDFSDYSALAQGAVSKDTRTSGNPLTKLMEQAVFGTQSRDGNERTAPKTDDWDVMEISLEIRPR